MPSHLVLDDLGVDGDEALDRVGQARLEKEGAEGGVLRTPPKQGRISTPIRAEIYIRTSSTLR